MAKKQVSRDAKPADDEDQSPEMALMDEYLQFYADPLGYVIFNFPWDDESSGIQTVKLLEPWRSKYNCEYGPDQWACEFLDELGAEIREGNFDGKNAIPHPIQFSTASGHGIGKSTLVAWLVMFIMDTRPFCKGTVTANTADQLKSKTWAEVGKWWSMSLSKELYTYTNSRGSMTLKRLGVEGSWFVNAQTCKEENSESFAGQHAANSTSFYIFDEASAIPEAIYNVREGGLLTGEAMTFDFGNPTRNSGRFFDNCKGDRAKNFIVREIDSRSVQITSQKSMQRWLEDYGEDSDFFRVRVRGMFPKSGSMQFIPTDLVEQAMDREGTFDRNYPMLIGVDVGRFGGDDSVIYPRMGNDARTWGFERHNGLDSVQLAGKVIERVRYFTSLGIRVGMICIDVTGGVGSGVYDNLFHLGYPVTPVYFGGTCVDKRTYRYKVDELYGKIKEALPRLLLPKRFEEGASDLKTDLTAREFGYTTKGNYIHLEAKEDFKERIGRSPDIADALACTYAADQAPGSIHTLVGNNATQKVKDNYDPLDYGVVR